MPFAVGRDQLREDRGDTRGFGGTADVVLARRAGRGVDHEFLRRRIVGGRGLQGLHVAAVAGLGHREAAQQVQVDDPLHVGLVVTFGAEVLDGPTEQTPLHAGLDHQREVGHGEHLDLGHRRADVAVAAVFLLEPVFGRPVSGHDLQLFGHLGAGDDGVRCVVRPEDLAGQFLAHPVLHITPAAVEGVTQMIRSGGHNSTVAVPTVAATVMRQT